MADFLNPNNDPNIGSSRGDNQSTVDSTLSSLGVDVSTSATALLTTFVPAFILFTLWTLVFIICRRSQQRFYAPRSYLGNIHEHERSPELPSGWINWIGAFFNLSDTYVLQHSSLDGYFFLRFLRLMSVTCFVGCLVVWPILFPIHATGGAGNTQLDALSFSNVTDPNRYYAHVLVAWMFFSFIFYMVTREGMFYATLRQAYFLSPLYASRISSRTVLFMAVPKALLTGSKMTKVFGKSIRRIWITTDCKKLDELVQRRDKLALRLERLETDLIKSANLARSKAMKRQKNDEECAADDGARPETTGCDFDSVPWAKKVKRPTHRLRYLTGKKVDSIEWLRSELEKVLPEVEKLQKKHRDGGAKPIPAVFIEFDSQASAQTAYQMLSHHQPFQMTPRYIGITPQQIIWPALQYSWWSRIVRKFLAQAAITALIIFWSIPSAFVGMISNVAYLSNLLPFLSFINKLPQVIQGVISGLLPAVGLALLMSLVPVLLRFLARQTGLPTTVHVELFTQNAHFCFQVVQVFLVTTLTSAASAATSQIIKDPMSVKDLLAKNLPKASNFYISYFLLQGLVLSAGAVVQVVGFLIFKIFVAFFDTTPRKLYERWTSMNGLRWATVFPVFTNMVVIAITYSCIAPLILGFSSFGLYLVYQAYRYNLLFVYDSDVDTKGLIYPRALQQVLTGVYLSSVCMIGLFAIKGAIGPVIMMVLFIILMILAHISLNDALRPLLSALPRTLEQAERLGDGDDDDSNKDMGEQDDSASSCQDDATSEKSPISPASGSNEIPSPISTSSKLKRATQTTITLAEITRAGTSTEIPAFPHRKPSALQTILRKFSYFIHSIVQPHIYIDYSTLRKRIRQGTPIEYSDEVADNAYYPPSVWSPTPLLWVPRDAGGISRREVELTSRVTPMTDEEAHLDERNKVKWDEVKSQPPIWQEKVFY
ncbi:DUF221 domain-containing protein [Histoplasma capsulatum G186AR]|uniref:DUF221 domain-containing protein n=2 Tax=Ajellomyces capsulatus TaxID=5037 RepID=C0NQE5_AJECG|nr:DUF221 domain-containing protein [Histoplasma capsulatum G186AR]EEH06417.1 DUF221 domain-containing protein [Histoplasma capsulatum G186AR]KAG5293119.1 DUF221 domain-containing protein [Histoplasma capsulatum]QSS74570.1 DUF221 domain-containing protein [Histoplasma capsulatum G186AR]